MTDPSQLWQLPEEIILKIFEFCDIQSLGRLAQTCRRFKQLVYTEDCCWRNKSKVALGSNMISSVMQKRSKPSLSSKKKCEISKKWKQGLYEARTVARYIRCLPWIILEQNNLFCSRESMMSQYPRRDDGNIEYHKVYKFVPHTDDVAKFAASEDEIVTASRDGTVGRWRKSDLRFIHTFIAHSSDIHSVDAKNDIVVSGSRDRTIKIWKALPDATVCQKEINMDVRVLSVAILPLNKHFIAGLPGVNDIHPLQLYDLEVGTFITKLGTEFQRGAGILDIYPEFDHTFLSCGYDTTVKLWDIRTPKKHVASWMDPYDNGIYCVKSDHNITIVSGANRNGVIHIWDKRCTRYQFMHQLIDHNSPVYSVAFDASHIFAAFDRAMVQFSYLCVQNNSGRPNVNYRK